MNPRFLLAMSLMTVGGATGGAFGQAPAPMPVSRTTLPQDHEYQRVLRAYLRDLTETDYAHGVTAPLEAPPGAGDVEEQFRHLMLGGRLPQPMVGSKRGWPAVNAPGRLFTLARIEGPKGVMLPPAWPETVAFLAKWDYPGNHYRQLRAMKLRAFAPMCIHLTMLDDELEHEPESVGNRSDLIAPTLIMLSYPYPIVKDILPADVQRAYETGLRKMGRRVLEWGPTGEEPNLDLIAPVALWYTAQALGDQDFHREVDAYARRLYTDERYFDPAGYFVDRGGIDLGFAGQTNFYVAWAALAAKWPFARDALERIYRLRNHLCLPEPDGQMAGPSHFHTRFSGEAWRDQWNWGGYRDTAASFVTDEAACLTKLPPASELNIAILGRMQIFQGQINQNPVKSGDGAPATPYVYLTNDEIVGYPYKFRWQSGNFPPTVSFAFDHYPAGAYAHRLKLEREKAAGRSMVPFFRLGSGRSARLARSSSKPTAISAGAIAGRSPRSGGSKSDSN